MKTTKHPCGHGFAVQVSAKKAKQISGQFSLPRIGYGLCVREVPDGFGGFYRLSIENLSGVYFLASHNVERPRWAALFNVEGAKNVH